MGLLNNLLVIAEHHRTVVVAGVADHNLSLLLYHIEPLLGLGLGLGLGFQQSLLMEWLSRLALLWIPMEQLS